MPTDPAFSSAAPSAALIDSPLMRSAGKEELSLALMDARNHTLHLFAQYQEALEAKSFVIPQLATVNPPLWELGHVGWFQEWWISRNLQRALGTRGAPSHARLASIEPNADAWWDSSRVAHNTRWDLVLPDVANIRAYLLDTLEGTLDLLHKAGDDDEALYFYRLCLFHEDMHGEALAYTAQTLGLPLGKALQTVFTPQPMAVREPLLIPATTWQMGSTPDAGFAFDNERPQHAVQVPEFEIDAQPVTWAQFVEFVDDGGYDHAELWQPDGWQWLQKSSAEEGRRGPRYVDQIGVASGAVMQNRFGKAMRMQGVQPAMHMTWYEADAWCRWAGRRLPFEVEWEVAAHTASRRGFRWGDVWEWTGSTFNPYPDNDGNRNFKPDPYTEYSAPWFATHKVLRGGSFATRARMKNPKYRNFYLPDRDDIFCGFRSCSL